MIHNNPNNIKNCAMYHCMTNESRTLCMTNNEQFIINCHNKNKFFHRFCWYVGCMKRQANKQNF